MKKIKEDLTDAKYVKKNLHRLVRDLTSERYHSLFGTWSSSQFKDILEDEEIFIKKYIKKEIAREEREAFDTGTYFHTTVLEPHKIKEEIAVYGGKTRYGKEWDKFKANNPGKCIVTPGMKEQGDRMVKSVKDSPVAQEYLEGEAEVSLFTHLTIHEGKVFAPNFNKLLTMQGWVNCSSKPGPDDGHHIIVKVRADTLGKTFVSDLKSTSSNPRSEHSIRGAISQYKYDLSAALYLDMFSLVQPSVRDFIWIFASKSLPCAQSWRATKNQILVGRAKYMRAMIKLADCAQSNWELVDCLRDIEPLPHEMEWLRIKDTDLL